VTQKETAILEKGDQSDATIRPASKGMDDAGRPGIQVTHNSSHTSAPDDRPKVTSVNKVTNWCRTSITGSTLRLTRELAFSYPGEIHYGHPAIPESLPSCPRHLQSDPLPASVLSVAQCS
jgi:hypothetical protein